MLDKKKIILAFIFLTLAFVGCKRHVSKTNERITIDGLAQGTFFHVVYYGNADKNTIKQGIDSILTLIDNSLSLWNENSTLSRVNRNEKVKLDSVFIENFNLACQIANLTNGAFDFTIGNLVKAYGFANQQRRKLNDKEIDSLLQGVDYRKVSITPDGYLQKPNITSLDFNAVAQGYTTDKISAYLLSKGLNDFVVDVGGEVYAHGSKPNNQYWTIGIEDPAEDSLSEIKYSQTITLKNQSVVTSGSSRKYYVENGVKYSHTIDPKTGKPVRHRLLSVSVVANQSYMADGLATAFMVVGLDKAKAFLAAHKQYKAYFIYTNDKGKYEFEAF
ncbi:MAG: FAD:protein FMN transferase [Bacteroidales bacterium]|jgi:thiamine biosynthesis lipoprotein|nr:FAD:protein FMN transferase [Bacteroidales bacterium]